MKLAVITDTHAGVRSDSPHFSRNAKRFFEEIFFPTIEKEKIDTILHLGDLFERRKFIDFLTLAEVRSYFLERLRAKGLKMTILAGNHDVYYKNTNVINSLRLLLSDFIADGTIDVIDNAVTERIWGGKNFALVPWICPDNEERILEELSRVDKKSIVGGHFELDGFLMHAGARNEGGMDRAFLSRFPRVWSGHFHTKSEEGNIQYLGNNAQHTWADHGDERGFHIYDTAKDTLKFVPNPLVMFHKLYYDETLVLPKPGTYTGTCVKLFVVNKGDGKKFEKVVQRLNEEDLAEFTIHEDFTEFEGGTILDEELDVEDERVLMDSFIDLVETPLDKARLKNLGHQIYLEAQTTEF